MTDQQSQALKTLASKVMQGFNTLTTFETINRIMNISNRSVAKAMEGYRIMRAEKIIPDSFIAEDHEQETKVFKMFDSPIMHEFIERLGIAIERIRVDSSLRADDVMQVEIVGTPNVSEKSRFEQQMQINAGPPILRGDRSDVVGKADEPKNILEAPPEEKRARVHIAKRLKFGNEF